MARILQAMGAVDPRRPQRVREWLDLNRKFHTRIFASSGHVHVCRVAAMLRDTVEPHIRIEVMITGGLDQANAEHHGIFDAFRHGAVRTTGRLCREHCEHTARRLREGLSTRAVAATPGQ